MLSVTLALSLLLAWWPGSSRALAETPDTPILSDRFGLSGGAYFSSAFTGVQVGGPGIIGTLINLETDLDVSSTTNNADFEAFYRIRPRHTIEVSTMLIGRSGQRVIDRSIDFNDFNFALNTDVRTKFDSRLFKLGYRYSFINDGRVESGVIAGVSTYTYNISLDGNATAAGSGGSGTAAFAQAKKDVVAPIPTFGIFTSCALNRKLILLGSAGFFALNAGGIRARLNEGRVKLDYFVSRHLGIGAGIAGSNTWFSYSSNSTYLSAAYSYAGGFLSLDFTM
ncbi:MAG: hypothetical protein ACRENS_05305 [Candidatus Eiseniibacteriota bacterium]